MIEIKAIQVTKQDDDSYAANLHFVEGDKLLRTKTVVAFNKNEFKDKIRIFKEKIKAEATAQQNLLIIVQTAIDEVMAE